MLERTARSLLSLSVVALILAAASPGGALAAPGDPDGDLVSSHVERGRVEGALSPLVADSDFDGLLDGWELYITETEPLDRDSGNEPNTQLDSTYDSDDGGIDDGTELANGTNPLDGSDDVRLSEIDLSDESNPVTVDGSDPFQVARDVPVEFYWGTTVGDFSSDYTLQFSASSDFAAPVEVVYSTATRLTVTPDSDSWKAITKLGRIVYWRVLGTRASDGRVVSSTILSFEITGAPEPGWPADGNTIAPKISPEFNWTGEGFVGYRLLFTGSHRYGTRTIQVPGKGWIGDTKKWVGAKKWKRITALGNAIEWRVIGTDAAGRFGYSDPMVLNLSGGATEVAERASRAPSPDELPVFEADRGDLAFYRMLFSRTADFSEVGFAYPAKGYVKVPVDGTFSFAADHDSDGDGVNDWSQISALGPDVFWTVKGTNKTRTFFTWSDSYRYSLGTGYIIDVSLEGGAAPTALTTTGLNQLGSGFPTLSWASTLPDGVTAQDYRVIFGGNDGMTGPTAASGYAAPETWTMPGGVAGDEVFALGVADLGTHYPFLRIEGRTTNGKSFFSPVYPAAAPYLAAPVVRPVGKSVESGTTYEVRVGPSDDDRDVLHYELQEATNSAFTNKLRSFVLEETDDAGDYVRSFTHRVDNDRSYFYRARAVNAGGGSEWSNVREKQVTGNWNPVYTTATPCRDGEGNDIVLDESNDNNANGTCELSGGGWVSVCYGPEHICGRGYAGDYHYISSAWGNPDGTEKAIWTPKIKAAGQYEVWVSWYGTENRDIHSEYFVKTGDALYGPFAVAQNVVDHALTWVKLGTYYFEEGTAGSAQLRYSSEGRTYSEEADAAAFKYVGP